MFAWLVKKWFVVCLLILVAAGLALSAELRQVTTHAPVKWVVVVLMFLMALGLDSSHLFSAIGRPSPMLIAVVVGYSVLPASAWLAGQIGFAESNPDLALGLVVVGSVPCTLASATIWTRMAGGNDAVALLVTLVSNCTSFLATTFLLKTLTGTTVELEPLDMMGKLLVIILVPVTVGQLSRLCRPVARWADGAKPRIGKFNQCLILLIVLVGAADAGHRLRDPNVHLAVLTVASVAAACVVVHLVAMAVAVAVCRLVGIGRPEWIAAAFGASQKTLPVGLYIVRNFYGPYALAVLPLLLYHMLQLTIDTFVADHFNTRGSPPVGPGAS